MPFLYVILSMKKTSFFTPILKQRPHVDITGLQLFLRFELSNLAHVASNLHVFGHFTLLQISSKIMLK